ncbi:anhydro-N-acetylmuramic acid kinase [Thalassotalea euphylliae]|uniref:Anhydro-N-acetylmuramic acid kinase n=1 Tax=Thalassotalea euphylliae TaxID=1655234 RepID=A0A3E0TMN8_9GAMM|nr:anhydro-N-acetylmuramic acid kinase [Thalassotalea euphylliae]REL25530.1 anhydro-N-acetylmuramic acid kinase [Thalassotalea euphylliae]
MATYYIGLMSGTSADGIDVALVTFNDDKSGKETRPRLVASHYQAYDEQIKAQITSLYCSGSDEIERANRLDKALAQRFAQAVEELLRVADISADDVIAIGNHGQTIRHRPSLPNQAEAFPFTLQIGCSQTLACLTGIPVVGQFRVKDIALGGQGAPLVPPFHQFVLASTPAAQQANVIVNIGGIANLTYLPTKSQHVLGYDTGPGNCLLDDWYQHHHNQGGFDESGAWAASGQCNDELLTALLSDAYFSQPAPKSTGREVFNLAWLTQHLTGRELKPEDVQATLLSFTARTIADEIQQLTATSPCLNSHQKNAAKLPNIWLCGGGRQNPPLKKVLAEQLNATVAPIDALGIDGDQLEAMAFAWLAYAFTQQLPSNLPAVTGAKARTTLGVLFTP